MISSRLLLRLMALLCFLALAIALISQHLFGMRPCAWCVLQRLVVLAIGVVALLASTQGLQAHPIWRQAGALAALLLAVSGAVAAWYQYRVAAVAFSCAQTFADKFMTQSGLDAGLPWLFGIQASCSDARVTLLGVEYALWGMLIFVLCGLLSVWVLFRRQ